MSHELPDDIEEILGEWEAGQRDQARSQWLALRERPGTIGRIANRCLELAEQGVDMIRDELGPVPAPDEIGWEDLLMTSLSDDDGGSDDLELSNAISSLSPEAELERPMSDITALPPADDRPEDRPEDYQVDDFFGTPRHDDIAEDEDDDFFDDFLDEPTPSGERPTLETNDQVLAAARERVVEAPSTFDDDDDDDAPLLLGDDTRRREPTHAKQAAPAPFDDFFAATPPPPLALEEDVYSSGERRAADALTRGTKTPVPRSAPLDAPPVSAPADSQAAADAFFGDLFDEFGDEPPRSPPTPPARRPEEPEWLGGIEPVPEPRAPQPESDVSSDLDDLREIFGETNRLVAETGSGSPPGTAADPWADVASELTGAGRAPRESAIELDAPRRHTPPPSASGSSRYAPEPEARRAVRRGTEMSFPRLKTPVRATTPIGSHGGGGTRTPLEKCQQMLDNGNTFGAYVRALNFRQDGEAGLDAFISLVQEQLLGMAVELIKPLDRCPKLKIPPAAIPSLKHIDARGGYLLSQIDGNISIELLIELGAMPRADAALLLLTLAERDIIALD